MSLSTCAKVTDRCCVALAVERGRKGGGKNVKKEGRKKSIIFSYLSRVNNDTVITEHCLFRRFNVRLINSTTTIINQYGSIAG